MDDIERKREQLKMAYPNSITWPEKVDKMSPEQVIAVYLKMKEKGKV